MGIDHYLFNKYLGSLALCSTLSWVKGILWWPKLPPSRPPRPRGSAEGRNSVNGPRHDILFTIGIHAVKETKRGVTKRKTDGSETEACRFRPPVAGLFHLQKRSSNQPQTSEIIQSSYFFFPKAFYRIILRSLFRTSVRAVETLSHPAPRQTASSGCPWSPCPVDYGICGSTGDLPTIACDYQTGGPFGSSLPPPSLPDPWLS